MDKWIGYLNKRKDDLIKLLNENYGIDVTETVKARKYKKFRDRLTAKSLKEFKVAAIMDRFTLDSYSPECQLLELTPTEWKNEIDSFNPDLIFIESAWHGKDGLWYKKIANGSDELNSMSDYAHKKNIPVIFWNKEDPIYTDTFMQAASCADVVFTTDIDCISKYKKVLEHNEVYFLHFAAQPKLHNPIEKYERKDKYCFAGAYYHRYPERAKVFDQFSNVFMETKGIDIYDRNFNNPRPEFAFPDKYKDNILGTLDPSEIDVAYKGYYYGINMNSVNQSQTMFARRVFELLASNTIVVGNYSRGVKNLFGDLTICTDDSKTLANNLNTYCADMQSQRKYRLLGLRKVLSEHLYEDRLDYIVGKTYGISLKRKLPRITLLAKADSNDIEKLIDAFNNQTYENKRLIIISDHEHETRNGVKFISQRDAESIKICDLVSSGYVGVIKADNYYGKNYLMDMALTFRYLECDGVGKKAYYKVDGNEINLYGQENVYRNTDLLYTDRAVVSVKCVVDTYLDNFVSMDKIQREGFFAIDEFNFCEGYTENVEKVVGDLEIADGGIAVRGIEAISEGIPLIETNDAGIIIEKQQISREFKKNVPKNIVINELNDQCEIDNKNVNMDATSYVYLNMLYDVETYSIDNTLSLIFKGKGNSETLGCCIFYDESKNKISPIFCKLNRFTTNDVPENAKYFKLGLRMKGDGKSSLKRIIVGQDDSNVKSMSYLAGSDTLVLTNQYPSYDNLYRQMFIHKRVKAYRDHGVLCDVMKSNPYTVEGYREFENINIIEGHDSDIAYVLDNKNINTVCIHFLDEHMWNIIKNYSEGHKYIIWSHGADIVPWWRREFLYKTQDEKEKARELSDRRQNFWREVFNSIDKMDIHFVYVSQYFADIVFEDYNLNLPKDKYSIIHNYIDSEMFNYVKKDASQRKKILSIRPYANDIYANDLSVKCIIELSHKDYFSELEFLLIGDGVEFDKVTAPLKKFSNVTLRKQFIRQDEIAELHKQYGIFLVPTREDTQGVSRDEAMSSGLVPVTNAVACIPEFVDDSCGILAPGEDYKAMADGIEKLYYDEELFMKMSEKAAKHVRELSGYKATIERELELIRH